MHITAIVTLLTDFGLTDSYVAQMRGVILNLAPRTTIVDISHEVPPFDVPYAARLLAEAAPEFPPHTIHLAVVDPGVGSSRRRVILQAKVGPQAREMFFIGPDNSLFNEVLQQATKFRAWEISKLDRLPKRQLSTFDGRDVFAPTAALLATGLRPEELGAEIEFPFERQPCTAGKVVAIDRFGNAITNLSAPPKSFALLLEGRDREVPQFKTYEQIPPGALGAVVSSRGTIELAVNCGSAAELYRLVKGQAVSLK